MEERTIHLKIKVKSLVDEAKTIRAEANKTSGMAKWRLNQHRKEVVRPHIRFNLLAYGILQNTPYCKMERKCAEWPDFYLVAKTAKNFGASEEQVDSWIEDAKNYLNRVELAKSA